MIDTIRNVVVACMAYLLLDEPWQLFGFKRIPKHGALIQRFRSKWRVRLEHAIGQEILIIVTAAHVVAGVVDRNDVDEIVGIYVEGPDGKKDLWKALGYGSANEATGHLRYSICTYIDAEIQEWLQLTPTRIGTLSISDSTLAAKLSVGAIRLAQAAQTMVLYLRTA